MIISEKQILQLMQIANAYLNTLGALYRFDKNLLDDGGLNNKEAITELLQNIANQQSQELKVIE